MHSAFDSNLISLFNIAEQQPKMFSEVVKVLLLDSDKSNEKLQVLLKTCFLYFFQLLGISEDDKVSLNALFAQLEGKKQGEMTKDQISKLDFDATCFAFNGPNIKTKACQNHLRAFKRFAKVLVNNLVDVFPSKQSSMTRLLAEIIKFSGSKVRLFRHGFTQVGLEIFHGLLTEVCKLETLKGYFSNGEQSARARVDQINAAIRFFLDQNAVKLAENVVLPRMADVKDFIRKAVYDGISELGPNELKLASKIKNLQLISRLFKGIVAEDASLAAMSALLKICDRTEFLEDKAQRKVLEKSFNEHQLCLLKLAAPSALNVARKTSALAIAILQKMALMFPNTISEEARRQVASCIHSGDAQVRDEAAKFILKVCSDFDDADALL